MFLFFYVGDTLLEPNYSNLLVKTNDMSPSHFGLRILRKPLMF